MNEPGQTSIAFESVDSSVQHDGVGSRRELALSTNERQFYLVKLDQIWFATDGKEFERRIADILYCVYEGFVDPDSYGNQGDWGCDGYIDGGRALFACYGAEFKAYESDYLKTKVKKDLKRAFEKWPLMQQWTFISNARRPADFMQNVWEPLKIEYANKDGRTVELRYWGHRDIKRLIFNLSKPDLDLLFPGSTDDRDFSLEDFIALLDDIVASDDGNSGSHGDEDGGSSGIQEVSPYKMDYNQIDEEGRENLKRGMRQSHAVSEFFSHHPDPAYGDRIAQRMHANYLEARRASVDAMGILDTLYQRVGGRDYRSRGITRRMSTYAAVAYFFQTCDVFENAPEDWCPPEGLLP